MTNQTRKTHNTSLPRWMQHLMDNHSIDAWLEDADINVHDKEHIQKPCGKLLHHCNESGWARPNGQNTALY